MKHHDEILENICFFLQFEIYTERERENDNYIVIYVIAFLTSNNITFKAVPVLIPMFPVG